MAWQDVLCAHLMLAHLADWNTISDFKCFKSITKKKKTYDILANTSTFHFIFVLFYSGYYVMSFSVNYEKDIILKDINFVI